MSAMDLDIAHYKRELRQAETHVQLNARIALFNMSETRLHLFKDEQDAIESLIAQRRRELSEGDER